MNRSTYHHIKHARVVFRRADRRLDLLRGELAHLHSRNDSEEKLERVDELLTEWLLYIRQVFVALTKAARAVGMEQRFKDWWNALDFDPELNFFRDARNDGFKNGDVVIREEWLDDPDHGELGYFVLAGNGELDGEPVLAHCHEFTEWTYQVMCDASEKLFDRFRDEALEEASQRSGPF